jgi:polyisoprenoid-binding protein YceI
VKGTFTTVDGQGEVRADGSAVGTVTLDAATLDTKNAKRDAHLRGSDFFDVENHPEITFAVRSAELRDGDQVHVIGQLTARGVSRPQSFTARLVDASADAVTLQAEFSVDREQFGLGWNQLGMIRGLTTITAALTFKRSAA